MRTAKGPRRGFPGGPRWGTQQPHHNSLAIRFLLNRQLLNCKPGMQPPPGCPPGKASGGGCTDRVRFHSPSASITILSCIGVWTPMAAGWQFGGRPNRTNRRRISPAHDRLFRPRRCMVRGVDGNPGTHLAEVLDRPGGPLTFRFVLTFVTVRDRYARALHAWNGKLMLVGAHVSSHVGA